MEVSHKKRFKREISNQSYKHLLEKQKLDAQKSDKDTPPVSQEPESATEEDKLLHKRVSSCVRKKALDKKSKRIKMSTKENKTREEVMAARELKKQSKQKEGKVKNKDSLTLEEVKAIVKERKKSLSESKDDKPGKERKKSQSEADKSKDEVDKATAAPVEIKSSDVTKGGKNRDQILAERAAKKAAKVQKKGTAAGDKASTSVINEDVKAKENMTVKDVTETLLGINKVFNDIKGISAGVEALNLKGTESTEVKAMELKGKDTQQPESGKTKAELRAERRAKQEAQRAAKQGAIEAAKPKEPAKEEPKATKLVTDAKKAGKAMSPKPKAVKKANTQNRHRVSWFGQEYNDNVQSLKTLPVNSHIHPAFIKLGVQLSSRVIIGENARCIALLDALKKMTKDYLLPVKTEFSRGLDSHLTKTMEFLASMRQSSACEKNAIKFFRHHLTQLPNNVNEYDAKKTLQDEIDRYIREQIDVAGEAISADVRNKISPGDIILTYGFSSLVERCLVDAHGAGVQFRTIVCGAHGAPSAPGARELTRRLRAEDLMVDVVDITSLATIMQGVSKVLLGASSILNNGSVLASAGTALVARAARVRNVPVLVACETHKFSERVQTDAFVYNELGDPNDLNDVGNDNWVLKDWRSMPLAILNLTYDVTPASLVTAVVTELAILPCTSAPVVLRFRGTAYGI